MRRLWLSLAMLGRRRCADGRGAARGGGACAAGWRLRRRDDRRLGSDRPAALVHHDRLVARVRDRGQALQLPGQARAGGQPPRPEVASRFTVSNLGKRYTFFIRKGFRFSDGTPVTARNFAYAIDRVANHDLASPGAQFITDPNGTEIVGAKDVNDGVGIHVSGVRVKGNRLIINLTRPDGDLPVEDHDAVLPGDFDQAPARSRDRRMSTASPTSPRPARTRWSGTIPTS